MSSGDSSSESVRAAGQPMRGKADREERKGQPWESEEGDPSTTEGPGTGKGCPGCFKAHLRGGGEEVSQDCGGSGGTDSAQQWLPHPLWQRLHSTSHLPPFPGGPPASSYTPAIPAVGEGKAACWALVGSQQADPLMWRSPPSCALFPPLHEVSF